MSLTYIVPKQSNSELTPVKSKITTYFAARIYIRRLFYIDQGFENGRDIFL